MRCRRNRARRGVLLLVILGLLAMFGLVAVAFVVITGQADRTAQIDRRVNQYGELPEETLHEIAMQVFRGVDGGLPWVGTTSVIGPHSLLEDIYSHIPKSESEYPVKVAEIGSWDEFAVCGGQLMWLGPIEFGYDREPFQCVGNVITMLDGPARGCSSRIVDYRPDPSVVKKGHFLVVAFEEVSTRDVYADLVAGNARECLINGTPFSGTGFGYHKDSELLNAWDLDGARPPDAQDPTGWADSDIWPYALLPNPTAFRPSPPVGSDPLSYIGYWDPAGPGGANEDNDAVDFQNMLLAAQITDDNGQVTVTIPSLHRPALIQYWMKRMGGDPTDPLAFMQSIDNVPIELQRKIILRPLFEYHPEFTDSNLRFHPAWDGVFVDADDDGVCDYAWDVDNDGDGQPDGIWVDLGFPVRTMPDGRKFKPLASILCVDLGGRLNLNAHGCLAQTGIDTDGDGFLDEFPYYDAPDLAANTHFYPFGGGQFSYAGAGAAADLPNPARGQGYGPAEINLRPLFSQAQDDLDAYRKFLEERYGPDELTDGSGNFDPVPGMPLYDPSDLTMLALADDPLSQNKWYEYGGSVLGYWAEHPTTSLPVASWNAGVTGAYGSPLNPQGDCAIGLDPAGRPLYCGAGVDWDWNAGAAVDEQINDPYESDFSGRAARGRLSGRQIDSPFTVAEFERLVRPFDADATRLDPRLFNLTVGPNGRSVLHDYRREITPESRDVPCPSVTLTPEMRRTFTLLPPAGLGNSITLPDLRLRHPAELLLAKMEIALRNLPTPIDDPSEVRRLWRMNASHLFPRELLAGLRMDVNRPFGNGRDDTPAPLPNEDPLPGFNVVDEPGRVIHEGNRVYKLDENYPGEIHQPGGDPDTTYETMRQVRPTGDPSQPVEEIEVEFDHVGGIDVNGDGNVDNVDRALARQLYARHLYVMALIAMDFRVADPANPTPEDKRLARTVAQWAVNVVDFRDRDSIMTPFEYDLFPFSEPATDPTDPPSWESDGYTWDVDGVIDPTDDAGNPIPEQSDDQETYRGLVWGCERPELLITETLAFHDRRTQDLANEQHDPAEQGDNSTEAGRTDDIDPDKKDVSFDQRKKPQGSLFAEVYNPTTALEPQPAELCYTPDGGVQLNRTVTDLANAVAWPVWRLLIVDVPIAANDAETLVAADPDDEQSPAVGDRSIYFVDPAAAAGEGLHDGCDEFSRFYTDAAIDPIMPGRYAVLGPGKEDTANAGEYVTYLGTRTDLDVTTDPTVEPADKDQTRQIRLMSSGNALSPVHNNNDPGGTEPADGAIRPVAGIVINQPNRLSVSEKTVADPYRAYTSGDGTHYEPAIDRPLDYDRDAADAGEAGDKTVAAVKTTGATARVCVVHLQRLANPLQPYDRNANPYRTVDSMPIDLVAFNGWARDEALTALVADGTKMFASHQRGETNQATDRSNNLWIQRMVEKDVAAYGDSDLENPKTHRFEYVLQHSLGYLNTPFEPRRTVEPYLGDPQDTPFPWLTWNNRPFVSHLELLLVPMAKSSWLLNAAVKPDGVNPARAFGMASTTNPYKNVLDPFPHLLNFFRSKDETEVEPFSEFHRLLELVHVPSRFVGAEIQCNPEVFATSPGHDFRPPFNWISRYRDPGRINVNTVFSPRVWQGLMNYFPDMDTTNPWKWGKFNLTRQGYDAALLAIDPDYPTRFAGVFRSSGGGSMVPLDSLKPVREVNATLLRQEDAKVKGPDSDPNPPSIEGPLFEAQSGALHNDTNRNPYFRYQGLQRLGNLVTTRSNVYAIWITVGYFEVEPNPKTNPPGGIDDEHPDGYALGQELGLETGEIRRHRAFYIFDRSIPVGFQRGCDHNVEKAILLKRFIE